MGYVSWCDDLVAHFADQAEDQMRREGRAVAVLDVGVTGHALFKRYNIDQSLTISVMIVAPLIHTFGVAGVIQQNWAQLKLNSENVKRLRDASEWHALARQIDVTDTERSILVTLNRMSEESQPGFAWVNRIAFHDLAEHVRKQNLALASLADEAIYERVRQLADKNLAIMTKDIPPYVISSYLGLSRIG